MVRVETGARLHFGFQNLSLAHSRLYGGIGVGLSAPIVGVEASKAEQIDCSDEQIEPYVERAVDVLDVPGAAVEVHDSFERHVGLGSGTQITLASLVAIATAYTIPVDVRETAPELGRGGRSGIGVATFETGGFVVDSGHRTDRFTTRVPERGTWSVPQPIITAELPSDWRFLLVTPETTPGQSGESEQESMQSVIEGANARVADEIAAVLTRNLLPAIADEHIEQFGDAVERIGRLNGAWYADEQGGVYRPPAGELIRALRQSSAIVGAGQSSWGPTVYGVTDATRAAHARETADSILDEQGIEGVVRVVEPRTSGYRITDR